MAARKIHLTIDIADRTTIVQVEQDWDVQMLYLLVGCRTNETKIDTDRFDLIAKGQVLDKSKLIRDYDLAPMDRVGYWMRTAQGCTGVLEPLPGHIQVTTEPCSLTCDDDPGQLRARMPCGCVLSAEALELYCTTAVDDGAYEFKCPVCEAPWEFFLIRHVLSATTMTNTQLNDISRKLDKNFVQTPHNDVRQCGKCKTYCMRDFSGRWYGSRNRVVCNVCTKTNNGRTVEFCWACGQQWRSGYGDQCGNPECGPASTLKLLATCQTKEINGAKDVPDTRACPGCGILIFHVKDCKHMTCPSCETNFCFVCLKPQDAKGDWQCGSYLTRCEAAPRQTTLDGSKPIDETRHEELNMTSSASYSSTSGDSSCAIL